MLLYAFYDTDLLYKNATYKTLTQCFVIGELMATSFLLTFGLIAVRIMYRSNAFHHNFIRPFVVYIIQYILSQIGRLISMCYQFGWLEISGVVGQDAPLLFSSVLRLYTYSGAFTIFSTIFIERSCAVYFIKDYEYVERPLIESYLHLQSFSMQSFSVMVYSFTGGYYDALTFKLNLPFMTLWLITVWFLFRNVYIENNRALNQLFETFDARKYTLSRRFQLDENRRVLKLFYNMFMGHAFFCSIAMCIFTLPHIIFDGPSAEVELCAAFLECYQGLYGVVFICALIATVPSWRHALLRFFGTIKTADLHQELRRVERRESHVQTTQLYFQNLRLQWA